MPRVPAEQTPQNVSVLSSRSKLRNCVALELGECMSAGLCFFDKSVGHTNLKTGWYFVPRMEK